MNARRSSLHALMLLGLVLAASAAAARTYTIGTFVDDTLPNANCTLREAIRAARDDAPVDECPAGEAEDVILLPDGLYYFGGPESIFIDTSLAIRGTSQDPTAVTIDLGGAGRFLFCFGSDSGGGSLAMSGITLQNGFTADQGGALSLVRFGLALDRMRFVGNQADAGGGAVYFHSGGTAARLLVSYTSFESNSAGVGGGAMKAVVNFGGVAELEDTLFVGNSVPVGGGAVGGNGGALELQALESGTASLLRCRFETNSVSSTFNDAAGGGAYLIAAGGALVARDVRFLDNRAIVPNTAIREIAALAGTAYNGGVIDLDRVLVHGSVSSFRDDASDVRLRADSSGAIALTNAQVTRGTGDGITAVSVGASITLGYLTVAEYPLGQGAVLVSDSGGTVVLHGSLLAYNGNDVISIGVGVQTIQNCATMAGDFPGFANAAAGNYRLTATSAAVDAGDATPTRPFDLDHAPRRVAPRADCGAYELGGLFGDGFESGDTSAFSGTQSG
jgi:CSLREA domain-containing protein